MWTVGTCINGCLSSSHRHIGCISNQCCSLHDALNFAVHFHSKLLHKTSMKSFQCELCYIFSLNKCHISSFLLFTCLFYFKLSGRWRCQKMVHLYVWQKSTNLRKVAQHFRHFISTLTTANIDNDITVRVLGQRLWDYSFSTSKGSWYGSGAALHTTIQQK